MSTELSGFPLVRTSVLICAVLLIFVTSCATGKELEIKVRDPRPLRAALLILEFRAGVPITYEESPYIYEGEKETVIDDRNISRVVMKTSDLNFRYDSESDICTIISSLMNFHSSENYAGKFQIAKRGRFYNAFPRMWRDENGNWQSYTSVLDMTTSISIDNTDALMILDLLTEELSYKTKKKIGLGMVPLNLLIRQEYKYYKYPEQPMWVHLQRILEDSARNLSWDILCDAGPSLGCVINIHAVGDLQHLKDDVGFTGTVEPAKDNVCEIEFEEDEFERAGSREFADPLPISMTKGMYEPKLIVGDTSSLVNISNLQNVSDTIAYQLVIDTEGNVQDVKALRPTGNGDPKIIEILKKWRYKPAQKDGKAISVYWVELLRIKDGSVQRLRK